MISDGQKKIREILQQYLEDYKKIRQIYTNDHKKIISSNEFYDLMMKITNKLSLDPVVTSDLITGRHINSEEELARYKALRKKVQLSNPCWTNGDQFIIKSQKINEILFPERFNNIKAFELGNSSGQDRDSRCCTLNIMFGIILEEVINNDDWEFAVLDTGEQIVWSGNHRTLAHILLGEYGFKIFRFIKV